MKFKTHKTMLTIATALLIGAAAPAVAQDPYTLPDDTYISLSGTVTSPAADSFVLDYGDGLIRVELEGWLLGTNALPIREGDKATVYGEVDDDSFENTTIEAEAVYVEDLNSFFYGEVADEDFYRPRYYTYAPFVDSVVTLEGTVTSIDDDEFTLNTGLRAIVVETEDMRYNPLDEDGYQRIHVGDRVRVVGEVDYDLFEGREVEATTITTLRNVNQNETQTGS